MKVALYCRVSSDDQNVEQQMEYLKERFKGSEIVYTVKDTESGRLPLRQRIRFTGLLKMALEEHLAVVVYNLDRLTRNWDDVTYIERFFRENWDKCMLISASEPVDLSNAAGRMMFRIKMAVSCFMPEDMREKQRIGIDRARDEGKYRGGKKGRSWAK